MQYVTSCPKIVEQSYAYEGLNFLLIAIGVSILMIVSVYAYNAVTRKDGGES